MAKEINITVPIPNTAGAVRAQLRDAVDLERIAHAGGAIEARATVDGNVTRIIRTMEAPASARAYLKSDTIEVVEERTWLQSGANVSVNVTGFDITMDGRIALEDHSTSCILHFSGTVKAHLGVVSPLAEGVIKDRLSEAIKAECEALF